AAWYPMGAKPVDDIAVIELVQDAPADVGVARLAGSLVRDNNPLKVFGCRAGSEQGNFVDAKFMGTVGPGRVQLDGTSVVGFFIEGGYSGAAVWDTEHESVVGMVSARSVNRADRVAYMIPVRALKRAWPSLRTAERKRLGYPSGRADRDRMNLIEK